MTLWGKQAEQYNIPEPSPVVAFKGVKVGDFGGTTAKLEISLGRRLTLI